jgi:hypothetical protein
VSKARERRILAHGGQAAPLLEDSQRVMFSRAISSTLGRSTARNLGLPVPELQWIVQPEDQDRVVQVSELRSLAAVRVILIHMAGNIPLSAILLFGGI